MRKGDDRGAAEIRPSISRRLTDASIRHRRLVLWGTLVLTLVASLGFLRVEVDTDPENMLPTDDPVRVRNALMADEFGSTPLLVVGVMGEVETPETIAALQRVHRDLVDRPDVIAEASVSVASIEDDEPVDDDDVAAIVARVEQNAVTADNVMFRDPDGAALFIALESKSAATDVADAARDLVAAEPALSGLDLALAGQPLAEDAFGQEMFVNMAIFAPLAGLLVFLILLAFFRRLRLVLPAMMLAMATVIITMGALIGSGNTLHIMSSMIPIFLMPIAILDSVHVLSEFFDRDGETDPVGVLREVFEELYRPLGFTSLTTAVGFASLMFVPIPPVRVFGLFVAIGVGLAWLFTVTLLPAYLAVAPAPAASGSTDDAAADVPADGVRADRGTAPVAAGAFSSRIWPARSARRTRLQVLGGAVVRHRRLVIAVTAALALLALPGLFAITVNDNPVRWFRSDHEIRVAAATLSEALPGTYSASLLGHGDAAHYDDPETRDAIEELAGHLRANPEVGGVLTYVDSESPLFRADDLINVRMQLRTGDNVSMQQVVDDIDVWLAENPVPGVEFDWAGEAFLNLTWQDKMVNGMMFGFATTLVAIFALLVALFRSVRWAVVAMTPVVWTVLIVYGVMSELDRDFDMPIAVLSTMVLGIGVDFAIHFVVRYRHLLAEFGSSGPALLAFFGEPARALTRNAVVIAVGFSPLLVSALVPYVIVGALLASIVGLSWLATITVLPPLVVSMSGLLRR